MLAKMLMYRTQDPLDRTLKGLAQEIPQIVIFSLSWQHFSKVSSRVNIIRSKKLEISVKVAKFVFLLKN